MAHSQNEIVSDAPVIVQAPGRINIIGEHTDYNEGLVLPAAVDKTTVMEVRKNASASLVRITAKADQESFEFDLNNFAPVAPGWPNYLMGVVHELQKLGAKLSGFDAIFYGNVPIGAGMSSSASLECSLAFALNELFDCHLDRWALIKAAQMAEHHFVGIKCGIMDQFASVLGKTGYAMLLDCRSLEFEYIPCDLQDHCFLLLDTRVSHSLAESAYNERRRQCEEGVEVIQKIFPDVRSLRDVDLSRLQAAKSKLGDTIFHRCQHVISENLRVQEAAKALYSGDLKHLGALMNLSHKSLRTDYEVSCKELDFLVALAKKDPFVAGSRMMGGGFGGCTLSLLKEAHCESFIDSSTTSYYKEFGIQLEAYSVSIANGVETLPITA